jgi:hypothetical protein|tara:strand:+ start:351 stop:599 length:249 start_codon:yes stop_codon:yes gene_type:complete
LTCCSNHSNAHGKSLTAAYPLAPQGFLKAYSRMNPWLAAVVHLQDFEAQRQSKVENRSWFWHNHLDGSSTPTRSLEGRWPGL